MKIIIKGFYEASLIADKCTKIIGMVDPGAKIIDTDVPYHVEYFHDIDGPYRGFEMPRYHQIENILNFSKDFTKDDTVLIHCHAGISRSPAIGILVLIQHGYSINDAFEHIYKIRDCMNPNKLILEMGDMILELDCKLVEYYHYVWTKEHGIQYGRFAGQGHTEEMKKILRMFGS